MAVYLLEGKLVPNPIPLRQTQFIAFLKYDFETYEEIGGPQGIIEVRHVNIFYEF